MKGPFLPLHGLPWGDPRCRAVAVRMVTQPASWEEGTVQGVVLIPGSQSSSSEA